MKRMIVFVCTGNICRSPMAEYLFRAHIASRADLNVCSAGVMTGYGQPASRYAVKAMNELGSI
jgi:protein-tyrosine-phosphatase